MKAINYNRIGMLLAVCIFLGPMPALQAGNDEEDVRSQIGVVLAKEGQELNTLLNDLQFYGSMNDLQNDIQLALEESKAALRNTQAAVQESREAYQRAYNLILDEKFKEAIDALNEVVKKYPSSTWADDAGFWKVFALEKIMRPPEEVFENYRRFIEQYSRSKWCDEARANMIRLGKTLALSGKPEYAEKIRSLKESDEGDIAISALTALQMMGEDSMPEIIKLYETTRNPEVRERIVLSLSNLNNAKATDFIIRVAENDTSSAMREKAVNLLGMWISHSGIFGVTIQRSISMSGPVPPVPWVDTPKTTGTMPVQLPGIAPLQSPEKNAEKRDKILSALGRIARKDRDESVRGQALFWIGRSAPNDSQIALLETVVKTDPSISVRERVLFALSQVPENRGIPGLIAVARSDANVNLRTKAIQFLGRSKDPRARAALLEIAREVK